MVPWRPRLRRSSESLSQARLLLSRLLVEQLDQLPLGNFDHRGAVVVFAFDEALGAAEGVAACT